MTCDKPLEIQSRLPQSDAICQQCVTKYEKEDSEAKVREALQKAARSSKDRQMWFIKEFTNHRGRVPTASEVQFWVEHGI